MFLFTHLVFADSVKNFLNIRDEKSFYLGAIIPDIRYFADIPRERTHITLDDLNKAAGLVGKRSDFVKGYKVHLLVDELTRKNNYYQKIADQFPSLIQKRISPVIAVILTEIYFLENYGDISKFLISDRYPSMLQKLDISPTDFKVFYQSVQKVLKNPSWERMEERFFENEKLRNNPNSNLYRRTGKTIIENRFLKKFLQERSKGVIDNFLNDFVLEVRSKIQSIN